MQRQKKNADEAKKKNESTNVLKRSNRGRPRKSVSKQSTTEVNKSPSIETNKRHEEWQRSLDKISNRNISDANVKDPTDVININSDDLADINVVLRSSSRNTGAITQKSGQTQTACPVYHSAPDNNFADGLSSFENEPVPKKVRKPQKQKAESETLIKLKKRFSVDVKTGAVKCEVNNCRANPFITWRSNNLKRHLEICHTDEYAKDFSEEANDHKKAQVEAYKIVQDAVELVTVNGYPFALLSSTGMRGFIDSRIENLKQKGFRLPSINRTSILQEIEQTSESIVNQIKQELNGKIISLMFDIATKSTLSVLGLNATFMVNDAVLFRTLGVIQINVRHNAINIADLIYDILRKFDIKLNQVFSITTDNARNVTNVSKVLNSVVEGVESTCSNDCDKDNYDFEQESDEDDENIGAENETELQNVLDSAAFFENLLHGVALQFSTNSNNLIDIINQVNCGTHTLQLSINDGLKESDAISTIEEVKGMCVAMRTQVVMIEFRKLTDTKIIPPLSNDTRWNSAYLMVCLSNSSRICNIILIYSS